MATLLHYAWFRLRNTLLLLLIALSFDHLAKNPAGQATDDFYTDDFISAIPTQLPSLVPTPATPIDDFYTDDITSSADVPSTAP